MSSVVIGQNKVDTLFPLTRMDILRNVKNNYFYLGSTSEPSLNHKLIELQEIIRQQANGKIEYHFYSWQKLNGFFLDDSLIKESCLDYYSLKSTLLLISTEKYIPNLHWGSYGVTPGDYLDSLSKIAVQDFCNQFKRGEKKIIPLSGFVARLIDKHRGSLVGDPPDVLEYFALANKYRPIENKENDLSSVNWWTAFFLKRNWYEFGTLVIKSVPDTCIVYINRNFNFPKGEGLEIKISIPVGKSYTVTARKIGCIDEEMVVKFNQPGEVQRRDIKFKKTGK